MADEIESEDAYLEVFEALVEKGYFKLVETGGDIKHDIFHALEI
jgi:deoxyhypusine synthase